MVFARAARAILGLHRTARFAAATLSVVCSVHSVLKVRSQIPKNTVSNMNDVELYQENKKLQKSGVAFCLREYGGRIGWRGRDRIVDLGCGDGGTTAGALRAFLPSDFAQLVGCDVSARMVRHARAHYADARTTFRELDLAAPLPHDMRGAFDHAFSFYAVHWVLDQVITFTNIYDLLTPGGDCLHLVMTKSPLGDVFRCHASLPSWRARLRLCNLRFFAYHDSHDPEEELKTTMENIGFKNILIVKKVMTHTYETLEELKGSILALSPFDIPDELREEYIRIHLQIVRDLNIPTYRLEETDGQCRLQHIYSIMIVSASK